MYHDFYCLKENPFNVTADPDFFFSSKCHREAMFNLCKGIEKRTGLILITGEIGTGKTTLCRQLLRQSDKKIKFALILNPNFSDLDLLKMIMKDLGIVVQQQNVRNMIYALHAFLRAEVRQGYHVVIVIDEAQNLSTNQLEQLRLLSQLGTEKEKLLQIILMGQPELCQKLQLPALRQLRQSIQVHFNLQPLEKMDVQHYIDNRIKKAATEANTHPKVVFTEQAVEAIYHYTQGTPRTINILCDRALLLGFTKETYLIDEFIIKTSAREVLYCEYYL